MFRFALYIEANEAKSMLETHPHIRQLYHMFKAQYYREMWILI